MKLYVLEYLTWLTDDEWRALSAYLCRSEEVLDFDVGAA